MSGSIDETSEIWKIIHIPEKPPVLPHLQSTVDVIASVLEPKHANLVVRKLNRVAPLEGLRHVKRIQKTCLDGGKYQLSVILCLASENDDKPNCMPDDVLELVNTYQLSTFITKVCQYAATTKQEWEEQCKLWPTSFHPPTFNIEGITGFTEEDSLSVYNYMKLAVQIAKSGASVVNAAVIVDPSTRQVIASSADQVLSCDSSVGITNRDSCCSDQPESESVKQNGPAKAQKDSMLLKCSANKEKQVYKDVACLYPLRWLEQQHSHSSSNSWHPLRHAAIVAIENSAARDRLLFPATGQNEEFTRADSEASSPVGSPLKRQKLGLNVKDDEETNHHGNGVQCEKPYLCTGYDMYFVWEPCVMCAMAIVHQRIRRVFYALPNPNDGGLGSVHRLQGERSLNHHYAVFRVLMPEEEIQ